MYFCEWMWGAKETFANRYKCRRSAMVPEQGSVASCDAAQGMAETLRV